VFGEKLDESEKKEALKKGTIKIQGHRRRQPLPIAQTDGPQTQGDHAGAGDVTPSLGVMQDARLGSADLIGNWKAVSGDADGPAGHSLFLHSACPHLGKYALYQDSSGVEHIAINCEEAANRHELVRWCQLDNQLFGSTAISKSEPAVAICEIQSSPGLGDKHVTSSVVPGVRGAGGFQAFKDAMQEPVNAVSVNSVRANDSASDDARTLPVHFEGDGTRYRDYRDSVSLLTVTEWKQFPVSGPRTVKWLCNFFKTNNVTPTQWHRNWRHMLKLQITDPGVSEHEVFCRALECLVCYDQLNVAELGAIEILARRFQLHEERYRLKLIDAERGAGKTGVDFDDAAIFMGHSRERGVAAICPALLDHVAEQAKQEAAVLKERRKAHEERELSRKKEKG